jgi:hypothetical protein
MDRLHSLSYIDNSGTIGSTNGLLPTIYNEKTYHSNLVNDWSNSDYKNKIEKWGRQYSYDRRARRSVGSYRQDTISDINWGMTVLANGIKVISAIMTILAADNTDR